MGQTHSVKSVARMAAVFSRHPQALAWGRDRLTMVGDVALSSEPFAFTQTNYYEREMGAELLKQFHLLEGLADPGQLADWKLESNRWEHELAADGLYPEARPINIDPGYVTEAKLVLATTKDRDHRIYLRDDIYAEVTLYYHAQQWHGRPWTYPDYELPETIAFLDASRQWLRQRLKRV